MEDGKLKLGDCRRGDKCGRPNCKYKHPGRLGGGGTADPPEVRRTGVCKYDSQCGRPDCEFCHPGSPSPLGGVEGVSFEEVRRTGSCKYGSKCERPNCKYLHPESGGVATKNPALKTFPDCRFGVACNRPDCRFKHSAALNYYQSNAAAAPPAPAARAILRDPSCSAASSLSPAALTEITALIFKARALPAETSSILEFLSSKFGVEVDFRRELWRAAGSPAQSKRGRAREEAEEAKEAEETKRSRRNDSPPRPAAPSSPPRPAALSPKHGSAIRVLGTAGIVTAPMLLAAFADCGVEPSRVEMEHAGAIVVRFRGSREAGEVLDECKYGNEANPPFVRIVSGVVDKDYRLVEVIE